MEFLVLHGNNCPESELLGRLVPLHKNTHGYYESPETALQVHIIPPHAVVLHLRGQGDFVPEQEPQPYGSLRLAKPLTRQSDHPGELFPGRSELREFILKEVAKPTDRITGLTAEAIRSVLQFLPELHNPESHFTRVGRWGEMSSRISTDTAQGLYRSLYANGFVIADFDWRNWSEEAIAYDDDRTKLQEASLSTLYKLLSANLLADREVEGHFDLIVENGLLGAILERLHYWYLYQKTDG